MRSLLACLSLLSVALAGCGGNGGGDDPTDSTITKDTNVLKEGKGAISGLLIDDRYRPLANGLVLLQPLGVTATSNENGEFQFLNIDPGQYTARANLEGHEAAPQRVLVVAGSFVDLNLEARRIVSTGGRIITTEYNVFVACNVNAVAIGLPLDCTFDQSGDTDRAAFTANYTGVDNVTYMVTEMLSNKVGDFEIRVRPIDHDQGPSGNYAVAEVKQGDYLKVVNQLGVENTEHAVTGNNAPWNNTDTLIVVFYVDAPTKNVTGDGDFGASVDMGYTAKFVQSVFVGAPEVDLAAYHVLSSRTS